MKTTLGAGVAADAEKTVERNSAKVTVTLWCLLIECCLLAAYGSAPCEDGLQRQYPCGWGRQLTDYARNMLIGPVAFQAGEERNRDYCVYHGLSNATYLLVRALSGAGPMAPQMALPAGLWPGRPGEECFQEGYQLTFRARCSHCIIRIGCAEAGRMGIVLSIVANRQRSCALYLK
jgi:hypothetical protein